MKKVLITGTSGFIGSNLLETISKSKDVEIFTLVRKKSRQYNNVKEYLVDITNYEEVKRVFDIEKPDTVIHLAANPIIKPDKDNPNKIWVDNVLGTNNLVNSCQKGVRFVFASTITVYGDSKQVCSEYMKCYPTSHYAATKLACEQILQIAVNNGLDPVILRICANVGKNSTHGVVHDFIRKIKSNPEKLEVLGDYPGSSKPYLMVEDTVNAIIKACDYQICSGPLTGPINTFNITNNNSLNIEQLANSVLEAMGEKREIVWLGEGANWKGDNKVIHASNYLADKCLNWRPSCNSRNAVYNGVKSLCQS